MFFAQHGAIRTTLSGPEDYDNDDASGFQRIEAREIDTIGMHFALPFPPSFFNAFFSQARKVSSKKSARLLATRLSISRLMLVPSFFACRVFETDSRLSQIDSIDPAFAPATGTPETGGWSTRELRTILRGLDGLHIVSADIVEVAPAYDTNAELTTMAAADVRNYSIYSFVFMANLPAQFKVLFEVISVMAKTPLGKVVVKKSD